MKSAKDQNAVQALLFVQIASYRDPQLGPTLHDLIHKAAQPQLLHIGVCLQLGPGDQACCGVSSLPSGEALRGARLSLDVVPASASGGVCWARARSQALWSGEPYTLQIDSHMRFAAGWDQELLRCWQRCNDPHAVVSVYPNPFALPDVCDTAMLPVMAAKHFDEQGLLRLQALSTYRYPDQVPAQPLPSAGLAAGLLFGPGALIAATPYDPDLYFDGEEVSLALRLWTRGFNFYNPDRLLIFHLYKRVGDDNTTHWADHADWGERNARAIARVLALTNGADLPAPYGLGTVRTLEHYQQWSGIDFGNRQISADALAGRFTPPPPTSGAAAAG